jgi:hypothetical protein
MAKILKIDMIPPLCGLTGYWLAGPAGLGPDPIPHFNWLRDINNIEAKVCFSHAVYKKQSQMLYVDIFLILLAFQ